MAGGLCGAGIRARLHLRGGRRRAAAAARAQLAAQDEHGGAPEHLLAPVHGLRGAQSPPSKAPAPQEGCACCHVLLSEACV